MTRFMTTWRPFREMDEFSGRSHRGTGSADVPRVRKRARGRLDARGGSGRAGEGVRIKLISLM
jgi:hypothetical protein